MDIKFRIYGFLEQDSKKMKKEGKRLAKKGYNCHCIAMHMENKYHCYASVTWEKDMAIINCYSPTYS